MSRGDELRRLLAIGRMLEDWCSPGTIAETLEIDRSTVHRILRGIQEEVGLEKRRDGHRMEYRLPQKQKK